MSCFLVEKAHIDVLVCGGAYYDTVPFRQPPDPDDYRLYGQYLWDENVKSVNYKYDEDNDAPRYILETIAGTPDPVKLLKAINCYDYQACEHPDYQESVAWGHIDRLTRAIQDERPELFVPVPAPWLGDGRTVPTYETLGVYDEAPWEFHHVKDVL